MNERILELAKQATKQYSPTYYTQEWIQGFAKLIVAECAQVCRDQPNYYALKKDRDNCAVAIEEHFGVEDQVEDSNQGHTCPFKEDINNDYETLCDCDPEQTRQCAMDI